MTWTALLAYGVDFSPRFAWYIPGSGEKCAFLGLFLLGISILYVPLWWAVKTWLPTRKYSLLRCFSIVAWGGVFYGIFNLNAYFQAVPFAPTYMLIGILAIAAAMVLGLSGAWLFLQSKKKAPPFLSYLRANLWLSWFSSAHFILPLILFNVPIFDHSRVVVYWGMPILMLLVYLAVLFLVWPRLMWIFRLPMGEILLSADCRKKFVAASAPIRAQSNCAIVIAKPGLLNAVALTSQKTIVVGADLISCLDVGQLQAVLTHELGHLQDSTFMPKIRRCLYGIDFCVLLFFICIHTQVFPLTSIGVVLLCLAVILAQSKSKSIRLQAELYADGFVKSTDEDLWEHLISGLEKIRVLNGLDENFCKRHNFAHLDTDERIAGVSKGEKVRRPVKVRKMLKLVVVWLLIGGFSTLVIHHLPASDAERWTALHKAFHSQWRQQNDQQALASIQQALQLSQEKFGRFTSKTYISLNDLTEYLFASGQSEEAEKYALQALTTGERLYADKDLKIVRSLKNLARIYYYREDYQQAQEFFSQARKVQEDLVADSWDRADTLEWLSRCLIGLDRPTDNIPLYESIIELYHGLGKEGRESYLGALEDFAHILARQGELAKSRQYSEQALDFARKEFGGLSEEYAGALLSNAQELKVAGDLGQAAAGCAEALKILQSLFGPDSEEYGDALSSLADIERQGGNLEQAAQTYLARLHIYETLYGADSSYLIGDLWELGLIAESRREWAAAEGYFTNVAKLEEHAEQIESQDRIDTYEKLLAVLSAQGKTADIQRVERTMQDIRNLAVIK